MQEYKSIVNVISEFDENYGISTDIIVGFPGESQADFEESVKATEEIGFCRVHVFKYSKRGGTAAEKMQEHISSAEKSIRSEILIKAAEEAGTRFIQKNLGSSRRVLFEEYNEELGMATGLTDNYIKVYVEIEKDKREHMAKFSVRFSVYLPRRLSHAEVLAMLSTLDGIAAIDEV